MNKSNQIKLGAVLSYVSIAVNILAGLIYTPWMIRQIGSSSYGLYTLAYSLINLFLIDFGLSSATSRYISKYLAEGKGEKVNDFLGAIYRLYLIIDAVIFVVLIVIYFFINRIYIKLTPEELHQFKIVYIISASFAIFNFPFVTLNGILTAYEKFVQLKLADLIYRILVVGSMVIALLCGGGLYTLVAVNAAAGIIIILYKLTVIKVSLPVKVNFKYFDSSLYKDIFGFTLWVTVASVAQRLIFNITPTILGMTVNSKAIAVFGVITTIESYAFIITSAINGMFMPQIARIYASPDSQKKIMSLLLRVGKFQFTINGLIVVGFAVIGREFIRLWMGSEYSDAYIGILLVLIPGLFYNSLQIGNTTMMVTNRVKIKAFVNLAMGIINVILCFILSYFYGVIGACIAIFCSYSFRVIALNVLYKNKLKFDMAVFQKECYLKGLLPVVSTIVIGLFVNKKIAYSGWFGISLIAIFVIILYLVLAFFLALNKKERKGALKFLISNILHR